MPAAFTGPQAAAAARVTYRQLDYWCRTDLVVPTVRVAGGSGSQRLYSRDDVIALALVRALLDAGLALSTIRPTLTRLLQAHAEAPGVPTLFETPATAVHLLVDVSKVAASIPETPSGPAPRALTLLR